MSAPEQRVEGTTYAVNGMTCRHCEAAVRNAVASLPAVTDVAVDLAGGSVTVIGTASRDAVAQAIAEAGYELAS